MLTVEPFATKHWLKLASLPFVVDVVDPAVGPRERRRHTRGHRGRIGRIVSRGVRGGLNAADGDVRVAHRPDRVRVVRILHLHERRHLAADRVAVPASPPHDAAGLRVDQVHEALALRLGRHRRLRDQAQLALAGWCAHREVMDRSDPPSDRSVAALNSSPAREAARAADGSMRARVGRLDGARRASAPNIIRRPSALTRNSQSSSSTGMPLKV